VAEAVGTEQIVKEIQIGASPETVFGFFTEPDKLVRWLCSEATVDPRPGGVCRQTHYADDGAGPYLMRGEYVEVVPPSRVVFTWGWEGSDMNTPPGSTTVEVTLEQDDAGTRLTLVHRDLPEPARDGHDSGWVHKLERLAVAATGGDPEAR